MIGRYCGGKVPAPGESTAECSAVCAEEDALRSRCKASPAEVFALVNDLALNQALARVMEVVGAINGYLEHTASGGHCVCTLHKWVEVL
jgi:hypothetical protein